MRLRPIVEMAARRALGSVLHRAPLSTFPARRAALLRRLEIETVIDVGANVGQYALQLRLYGYRGTIHSYEPLASAYRELSARAAVDRRWHAHAVGLGRTAGKAVLHVAGNSQSSSLLAVLPRHLEGAPESAVVGDEAVDLVTLADLDMTERCFVKIDAQGSERAILDGAGDALDRVRGLELELSLVPLYDGETLFADMVSWLSTRGLELRGIGQGYVDPNTGTVLQVDALFARR